MTKWQLQDAKARFSERIDDTLEKGPNRDAARHRYGCRRFVQGMASAGNRPAQPKGRAPRLWSALRHPPTRTRQNQEPASRGIR